MVHFENIKKDIKNLKIFSKGWRGLIFTGFYNNEKVAIKVANRKEVIENIKIEIDNIMLLRSKNFYNIPEIIEYGEDFFIYKFIDAFTLKEVFTSIDLEQKKNILIKILNVLYQWDKIGFFKNELKKLTTNILISNKLDVYFIDFEKSRQNKFYKNIPQYIQFLKNLNILSMDEVLYFGKNYKSNPDKIYIILKDKILSSKKDFSTLF